MIVRPVDPQRVIADELSIIFQELTFLPGFTGSLIGANDSLEEEIIGLASWDSPVSIRLSAWRA